MGLAEREKFMQKVTLNCSSHLTPIKMAIIKKRIKQKIMDAEKLEPLEMGE